MNKKAQNFSEYALIIGIVTIALFAMQVYFKRGIQGILRVTADDLGSVARGAYYNETGKNASSQFLGFRERGMSNYTERITVNVEQEIVTNETPSGAWKKVINKDNTVTKDIRAVGSNTTNYNNFGIKQRELDQVDSPVVSDGEPKSF